MPFESKYNKDEIINAAFEIAEKNGFQAITARTVAKKINGSVAPIYFNFQNIQELIKEVVVKVFNLSQMILSEQTSHSLYENMGRAGFVFAERYPVFFRELVLTPNPYIQSYEDTELAMLEGLENDPVVSKLSIEERKTLILKVKAMQIGFQTMIANNQYPSFMTKENLQELFIETGNELARLELKKKEKHDG